jgi:biotin--protein ligase
MNVLVYTGPGTSGSAVRHTLKTLKGHLGGSYDVLSVSDPKILRGHLWKDSTALLVVPGGRDVPYLRSLSPEGSASIRSYVQDGGKYLGLWYLA